MVSHVPHAAVATGASLSSTIHAVDSCFGGPLLAIGLVSGFCAAARRTWISVNCARYEEKLLYFRQSLGVDCIETLVLDPVILEHCVLTELVELMAPRHGVTLPPNTEGLREELARIVLVYPDDLRRWQAFQSYMKPALADTLRTFIAANGATFHGENEQQLFSAVQSSCGRNIVNPSLPTSTRDSNLNSFSLPSASPVITDMIELQAEGIEEMKKRLEKLVAAQERIKLFLDSASDYKKALLNAKNEIKFAHEAELEINFELKRGQEVLENLRELQCLHFEMSRWVRQYNSWKRGHRLTSKPLHSGRSRRRTLPNLPNGRGLENFYSDASSFTSSPGSGSVINFNMLEPAVQINIEEPDDMKCDEPPEGYYEVGESPLSEVAPTRNNFEKADTGLHLSTPSSLPPEFPVPRLQFSNIVRSCAVKPSSWSPPDAYLAGRPLESPRIATPCAVKPPSFSASEAKRRMSSGPVYPCTLSSPDTVGMRKDDGLTAEKLALKEYCGVNDSLAVSPRELKAPNSPAPELDDVNKVVKQICDEVLDYCVESPKTDRFTSSMDDWLCVDTLSDDVDANSDCELKDHKKPASFGAKRESTRAPARRCSSHESNESNETAEKVIRRCKASFGAGCEKENNVASPSRVRNSRTIL